MKSVLFTLYSFYEFVFSILTSFIISIMLWRILILPKTFFIIMWRFLTLQAKFRLISRREGQLFRSFNVLLYSFQNSLYDIRRLMICFFLLIGLIIGGTIFPNSFYEQYHNEWTQAWGLVLAAIIAIVIYDQSRIATEKLEYDIRRNNNLIHLQYSDTYHGKNYIKIQIIFAIDEILTYVDYWLDDVKVWGKENNNEIKKKIQVRCDDHWKGIQKYNEILKTNRVIINEYFDKQILKKINAISDACNQIPEFNYEQNICKIEKLEVIVIQSLLLFKKWNIFTTHRFLVENI